MRVSCQVELKIAFINIQSQKDETVKSIKYLFADVKVLVGSDSGEDGDESSVNHLDQVFASVVCRDIRHQPKTLLLDRSSSQKKSIVLARTLSKQSAKLQEKDDLCNAYRQSDWMNWSMAGRKPGSLIKAEVLLSGPLAMLPSARTNGIARAFWSKKSFNGATNNGIRRCSNNCVLTFSGPDVKYTTTHAASEITAGSYVN